MYVLKLRYAEILRSAAIAASNSGNFEEAIGLFIAATIDGPSRKDASFNLAALLHQFGFSALAIPHITTVRLSLGRP
jgi:hypothetical protein